MQYIIRALNTTLFLSHSINPETNALTVTITSSNGETAVSVIDLIYEGVIIPITYQTQRMMSICYSPSITEDDVIDLNSETTLFISSNGAFVPAVSKLIAKVPDTTILEIANPRDLPHVFIPDVAIGHKNNVIKMVSPIRYTASDHVQIVSEAIFKPVAGYPSLYLCMAEGLDALQYSDVDETTILRVSYVTADSTAPIHNYVRTEV